MALPANPGQLASILKSVQPIGKDQFQGADFPGSYLWQRGGLGPEQYHSDKVAGRDMPKMAHMGITPIHPPITIHIPAGGIKIHGR